jgi:pilus assembly protein CpaB
VRKSTLVMIAFAVVFGLLAVFVAQSWLNNAAANRMKNLQAKKPDAPVSTIVVAAERLQYGTELGANHLREIPWPADALPSGAFAKISDVLGAGKRVVLSPVETNEPLDRVDVVLTRQIDKNNATTEVVLQNARVLAVDQSADERSSKPSVAKAVTLEVDTVAAQKVWLAASVGNLSLLLRKAGENAAERTRRVTLDDLSKPERMTRARDGSVTNISVQRGANRQDYQVPVEGTDGRRSSSGEDGSRRR